MYQQARSSKNPPPYYYNLNNKQQKNWMKNTKKMEHNEKLRRKYPPFRTSSTTNIIHLHHQTPINIVTELITRAKQTNKYAIDTESQKNQNHEQGALIQIQLIHSTQESTIILIETNFLPDPQSILFRQIKELCEIILNNNNTILTWGPVEKEFENFQHLGLIQIGKIKEINLQSRFREWYNSNTHPSRERRDDEGSDDSSVDDDPLLWSLQNAIAVTFERFLDKSLTVNFWQCGLDLNLNTWSRKIFSRREYNKHEEQQQRIKMIQYAVDDCTSVAELFFHMYPEEEIEEQQTIEAPPTKSTNRLFNLDDDLSDISEDELIELLKPKFEKKQTTSRQVYEEPGEPMLITTTTEEEIQELNQSEQVAPEQEQKRTAPDSQPSTSTSRQTKQEKQRRKNEKLKEKRRTRPDFQNFIRRPIYRRYDYLKIKAQLRDDNIHTSHQIIINEDRLEVKIGFKSREELQRATTIIRTNYFSRDQFMERWG